MPCWTIFEGKSLVHNLLCKNQTSFLNMMRALLKKKEKKALLLFDLISILYIYCKLWRRGRPRFNLVGPLKPPARHINPPTAFLCWRMPYIYSLNVYVRLMHPPANWGWEGRQLVIFLLWTRTNWCMNRLHTWANGHIESGCLQRAKPPSSDSDSF